MSVVERVRARFLSEQTRYERAWVTSINVIGLLIVVGIALDSELLLGTGQTGVFQRALYPYGPPALSLGVAVAEGYRRGVLLSAGFLVGYTLLLAAVGTLGTALATAPAYPIAGGAGVVTAVVASAVATR
ncbi:hypothetical protein [Halorientalis litorea]|jgi:hypothetical protein|uniref:hypothetical protein n=1 Tax=Halorientalis litorea TaxID=2931977 RepID=UPI001FF56AE6|nr:hypothetical protein [Halorientalis litorea]